MNLQNFQIKYNNEINEMFYIIKNNLKKNNISVFNYNKLYNDFVIYLYTLKYKEHTLV